MHITLRQFALIAAIVLGTLEHLKYEYHTSSAVVRISDCRLRVLTTKVYEEEMSSAQFSRL